MTPDQLQEFGKVISRQWRGFSAALASARHDLGIALGWGLITWGIYGFRPGAWAISIGIYLFADAILAVMAGRNKNAVRK